MMKRTNLITVSVFLCLLSFFSISQPKMSSAEVFVPSNPASIITPEGVEFTEQFIGPDTCKLYTDCSWILRIDVRPTTTAITEILVIERLAAELEVDGIIAEYPPGVEWDPLDTSAIEISWMIEVLIPPETAFFELEVSTDLNPADHQRYTSCGCYLLNSGPTLSYSTKTSSPTYSWTWTWEVCVPCDGIPLFSDVVQILPFAILAGTLVVLRKRKWI